MLLLVVVWLLRWRQWRRRLMLMLVLVQIDWGLLHCYSYVPRVPAVHSLPPPPPPHRSRRYLLLRVFLELLIELCELLLAHQLLMRMVPLLLELLLLRMLA